MKIEECFTFSQVCSAAGVHMVQPLHVHRPATTARVTLTPIHYHRLQIAIWPAGDGRGAVRWGSASVLVRIFSLFCVFVL